MSEIISDKTLTGDTLQEWTIEEYQRHTRGRSWYIFMIIFGLLLVLYGILSGNFLFALIIILFAIILFLQSYQAPAQIPFRIMELGIAVGGRFYKYTELKEFYIIYDPPEVKNLFIETRSTVQPRLRIPLLDENPVEVRHLLQQYLDEDTHREEEPFSDRLARSWRLH